MKLITVTDQDKSSTKFNDFQIVFDPAFANNESETY